VRSPVPARVATYRFVPCPLGLPLTALSRACSGCRLPLCPCLLGLRLTALCCRRDPSLPRAAGRGVAHQHARGNQRGARGARWRLRIAGARHTQPQEPPPAPSVSPVPCLAVLCTVVLLVPATTACSLFFPRSVCNLLTFARVLFVAYVRLADTRRPSRAPAPGRSGQTTRCVCYGLE
jgi:hypothetical protein